MKCRVYALYERSIPDVIRYVGQTRSTIDRRLERHISDALKAQRPTRCQAWILSVFRLGGEVCIRTIDANATWNVTEVQQIALCRASGHPLMNVLDGGADTLSDFRRRQKRTNRWQRRKKKRAAGWRWGSPQKRQA